MEVIEGETCPICMKKTLTLAEDKQNIPHFGDIYILSMSCNDCGFRKTDIDTEDQKEPVKLELEISDVKDLNIRVVKSSEATIKFPEFKVTLDPGDDAEGYVANVEKVFNDLLNIFETRKEGEESKAKKKKLRQYVDDILDIKEGKKKATLVIEDPSGISAIISDKVKKSKLKVK
jgi:zinc finger protein